PCMRQNCRSDTLTRFRWWIAAARARNEGEPREMSPLTIDPVLNTLEGAAVIASAIAGMILAADKRMDLIGAFTLACVNAFGGGTVRDLLLDNRPFYWMTNWGYVPAIFGLCLLFVYS